MAAYTIRLLYIKKTIDFNPLPHNSITIFQLIRYSHCSFSNASKISNCTHTFYSFPIINTPKNTYKPSFVHIYTHIFSKCPTNDPVVLNLIYIPPFKLDIIYFPTPWKSISHHVKINFPILLMEGFLTTHFYGKQIEKSTFTM